MSAPVDVLAAVQAIEQMRRAADDYAGDDWPEMAQTLTRWADALDPHRAAVAELIEAASGLAGNGLTDVQIFAAMPRLRAALARCTGGQS